MPWYSGIVRSTNLNLKDVIDQSNTATQDGGLFVVKLCRNYKNQSSCMIQNLVYRLYF